MFEIFTIIDDISSAQQVFRYPKNVVFYSVIITDSCSFSRTLVSLLLNSKNTDAIIFVVRILLLNKSKFCDMVACTPALLEV